MNKSEMPNFFHIYSLENTGGFVLTQPSLKKPGILNRFRDHPIRPGTKILMVGTFHPDIDKGADFFCSGKDNLLWKILPVLKCRT
jgi:hypothetical protein